VWGNALKRKLEQFKATPYSEIKCYEKSYRGIHSLVLTNSQEEELEKKINNFNSDKNALTKHM